MKRHYPGDPGTPRQFPGLAGGEVAPFPGPDRIRLREGGFDEEAVGTRGKGNDPLGVTGGKGCVGHIADLLPRLDPDRPLPQLLQREIGDDLSVPGTPCYRIGVSSASLLIMASFNPFSVIPLPAGVAASRQP